MPRALGLDFGTTNTVVTKVSREGVVEAIRFGEGADATDTLRTALCFWRSEEHAAAPVTIEAGAWAIRQFIDYPGECRFMQSLKTFAANPLFAGTRIFARHYAFEDLMEAFLLRARNYAGARLEPLPKRLVIGRPVAFAGTLPDPALATGRYLAATKRFGFDEVLFVYEPVAAAIYFARTLQRDATILVADFGGGTTDFSLMHFESAAGRLKAIPLAQGGVGIAGDTFDYRIIDKVILPKLGKGSQYQSMGKVLELPSSLFANFARWNLLSVFKTSDDFKELKRLLRFSLSRDQIELFLDLVENDQGYPLYKAVSEAKAQLSRSEVTRLHFAPLGTDFSATIRREDFNTWISEDLERIEASLDATLTQAKLSENRIDRVFLTGGTSFVPAVRAMFARRFGAGKLSMGDELVSIANGLALIGERDDAREWAVREPAAKTPSVSKSV